VQGALVLELGGHATRVSRGTLDVLTSFATHAALALRNAWLLAEVERLATIDGLTGVANRRTFENALHREVARAGRTSQPLSLVVLDIDHFKSVNDTLGHQAGDEVLRHVGAALASHAREVDLAARYGGEEFCVLLPACPPDDAMAVAERLRGAIAEYSGPTAVTVSAGVATLPFDAATDTALVAAADQALYRAKSGGRDRTVAAAGRERARIGV
jgi:diguanylate cyclase (GGDEF)-like protein